MSDVFTAYSTWKWVETHGETADVPVYRYRFDRTLPGDPASEFGAIHAADIEYAFNTLDSKPSDWQDEDRNVAELMATTFANFIRTGNPNGPGVPDWPAFGGSGKVMVFDSVSESRPEEFRARYEFLDSVVNEK
jgi:para-nitrobenzyl esterase